MKDIFGVGEMAERTRCFDWSQTALGPVEEWPEALLMMVNTMLSSRHPMFLWWGEELIQFYNDGYRPSIREDKHPSALGQPGKECWPEIWPIIGPEIEVVMTRGEATWHVNKLVPILRNGAMEDVYWTYGYSPVRDETGAIRGTLVVCTETTENIHDKQLLLRERERMADLFQQAPAFFALLRGPDHVFDMINQPYQELMGQRSLLGKPVREAIPEAEGQGFIALLDKVYRTGEPFVGSGTPIELARQPGGPPEVRYLDFVYRPRREADGSITGIIALGVDVTESKRASMVLMQSEKLNAVGRLASSIAHEINNPLEAVTNLIYLALQTAVNPETRRYLADAEIELRRVSAITSQTLRFHRQSTRQTPISAEELIDSTLALYRGRFHVLRITLDRRDRARRAVTCFEGEIRQVLNNLVGNAVDAMNSGGGRLLIRSREGRDWATGSRGLVITVADTGGGISKHARTRIFEPFFTTKGERGTGLGLWISREIIERHRGKMTVRSRESTEQRRGTGTVFVLFLPFEGD